jgi:hypothetical protein
MQKNTLTTKDYWLSNFLYNEEYVFYKISEVSVKVGEVKPNVFDML